MSVRLFLQLCNFVSRLREDGRAVVTNGSSTAVSLSNKCTVSYDFLHIELTSVISASLITYVRARVNSCANMDSPAGGRVHSRAKIK